MRSYIYKYVHTFEAPPCAIIVMPTIVSIFLESAQSRILLYNRLSCLMIHIWKPWLAYLHAHS